jgi:glycosyltransferase involved in cell wall biosynthesis
MLVRAAHDTGIPVIYHEVGIPFHPPGFEEVYERFVSVMPLCAEIAALSPALVEELASIVPHIKEAKVLPLISLDHNHTARNSNHDRPVTFGFSARLEHLKGPMRLLEAFRIAQQTYSKLELRIAGDGSQRQEFIDVSRAAGLENKCHLLGIYKTLHERAEFMDSYDVFVLPSLTEGTPNVIIEAMAHGKPTIASAVGGVPDLITKDVGILVPCDDQQALADAMVRLASDSDLRKRMGIAARKRYEQLFTPQAVLPVLVDFYQAVISKHATGASNNGKGSTLATMHQWKVK